MQMLRMPAVKATRGVRSHATVYTEIKEGLFTEPVKIGQRAVAWPDSEVQAICTARIAGATDEQIKALVAKLHEKRKADFAALGFAVGGAAA